jgi:hypothetical protein
MRGPDNAFYMAMTDLHIFAQRERHRNTEWQRDGGKYGWGNNRALVLIKSTDLILGGSRAAGLRSAERLEAHRAGKVGADV